MKTSPGGPVSLLLQRFLPRLKYPYLFLIMLFLFLADLVVPDFLPFIDEAMLGLLTVLVGSWKTRNEAPEEPLPPKDVTDYGADSDA
ncbi:MAG: hypothetical protein DRJ65_05720 [Acidobacteria bacterium]|nr:MAG: hypothetical protein DRJ65_05720 [Acidobacteriota bacterium]